MAVKQPRIFTTDEWGAKPPKNKISYTDRPVREIFHHTAGHHREISNPKDESQAEFFRYCRDVQHFHMNGNGWSDSGHNFMIGRNGMIAVGRHMSLPAIKAGIMVVSAHCPGQNDQPGVEHEHLHEASMTPAQLFASARLFAWICSRTRMRVTALDPHSRYWSTSCPAELRDDINRVKSLALRILNDEGYAPASFMASWRVRLLGR